MPVYRFEALDEKGKIAHGTIDADSLQDAKQRLFKRQVLVTAVLPVKLKQEKQALSKRETLFLTRDIARLLRAGLPLYETLTALEEKYRGQKTHRILLDLCACIRNGDPFSKALEAHSGSFDILYRSMISNAERSGNLPQALEEMARLLEKQALIRKQMVSTFLYPGLLGSFCLIVLSILLFFVIPSLFELFEGRPLHPFTAFVFACSKFALQAKWGLLVIASLFLAALFWMIFSEKGQKIAMRQILYLPFLKELFIKVALVRFFRASATLVEGGVPAILALGQAVPTLRHPRLEETLQGALKQLVAGESLHNALSQKQMIPPLIPRMLGIAQEGGNLPSMMHQIAQIYEEDLEVAFANFSAFAQPILLIILGGIVGFVLLAVLLPLTDVSTFTT